MAFKTIILKGDGVRMEFIASGEIPPGSVLTITSAAADTVTVHGSAQQNAAPLFAVEDDLQGKEIGDNYATGALVQANIMQPGDIVYAFVTNGQTAAKGGFAVSGGDGGLAPLTAVATNSDGAFDEGGETIYTNAILGIFLDSVDMAESSEIDPASARIRLLLI